MDIFNLVFYAAILGIGLLLYTFRSGLSEYLYIAIKNWKASAFIVVCLIAGVTGGIYASSDQPIEVRISSFALPLPGDNPGVAQIDSCKDFVTAKAEHRAGYIDPKPSWSDKIIIGANSYWDTCAQTFGMNYWKHDISIGGKNGGQMLCKTYHEDGYRSGIVDSWCSTVLDPAKVAPAVRKASSRTAAREHQG
jgi:hypothetical protein